MSKEGKETLQLVPVAQGMTLGDQLYDELFRLIIEGEFPENTRLPAEGGLASRFGVSRPIVRQALSRLKSDGLIISRRGSGNFVLRRPDPAVLKFVSASNASEIQRCFEYRIALEGKAAMLAAERRSAEHLKSMEKALLLHQKAAQMKKPDVDADYEFHLAVARGTMNRYFAETMSSLQKSIASGMKLHRNLALEVATDRMEVVCAEHDRIFRSIRDQSPSRAGDAMRTHLANAQHRILDRSPQPTALSYRNRGEK